MEIDLPLPQDLLIALFDEDASCDAIEAELNAMAASCYSNSANHGFWPNGSEGRNKGEQVALIHSEASELLEAVRMDPKAPSEHCPEITAEEEELADIVVRVMDYAAGHGLNLGKAFVHKMRFNALRPVKHGKKF